MKYSIDFEVPANSYDEWEFPQPKFKFMDRVGIRNGCEPESWETAIIVGMRLYYCDRNGTLRSQPRWEYSLRDHNSYPSNYWYEEEHLELEADISELQTNWDGARVVASDLSDIY